MHQRYPVSAMIPLHKTCNHTPHQHAAVSLQPNEKSRKNCPDKQDSFSGGNIEI